MLAQRLRQLRHVDRNPRLIAPSQFRSSHRSLLSDKPIAAPNRSFDLPSIAVLRIGATPRTAFLLAFGEKPGAMRTSYATAQLRSLGESSASQ
jgi:hypothetical protein